MVNSKYFFDSEYDEKEQLPRKYTVNFKAVEIGSKMKIAVSMNGIQVGDFIDDNSKEKDFYRFHDVFHYTFATMLGWSPCTRAMMKRKRKSNSAIDEFEDGARAIITEESISLILFNIARRKNFFKKESKVSKSLLNQIKEMTTPFEVKIRTKKDWERAILKGYSLFRELIKNNGGNIRFDMLNQSAIYES